MAQALGFQALRRERDGPDGPGRRGGPLSLRDDLQRIRSPEEAHESAAYLDFRGERVYCVTHAALGPRCGGVLVVPPFGRERMDSYTALVMWARRAASNGFDVLRFDYRATGESTGKFEDVDLQDWLADLEFVAAEFSRRLRGAPLVLHGVRFGALLASTRFALGQGDALLAWDPPANAKDMLYEVLRGKLLEDMVLGTSEARKTREAYVGDLLAGSSVEVDGHPWSRRLWESAQQLPLRVPPGAETRPWKSVQLVKHSKLRSLVDGQTWKVPVPSPPFWRDHPTLVPDLSELFEVSSDWLRTAVGEKERS